MENVFALLVILEKDVIKNALLVIMVFNVQLNVIVKMVLHVIFVMVFVIVLLDGVDQVVHYHVGEIQN
jgi:hypothetical protein